MNFDQRLAAAVTNACDRMGVKLFRYMSAPEGDGWMQFNYHQALNPISMSIWLDGGENHAEAWFWALHELEHLVFWRDEDPDMSDSPEMLYMPWGVGVLRYSGVPAVEYMRSTYNSATSTGGGEMYVGNRVFEEVGDWKYPLKSAWYLRARAANIAAGTIDERGMPTWRRPDWSKINIEEHMEP